ncbi:MAG: YbaK/EbsC family protein [Pseudomonadota bacterium]
MTTNPHETDTGGTPPPGQATPSQAQPDQRHEASDDFVYEGRPLTEDLPVDTGIIESILKGHGVNFVHRVFSDPVRDPSQVALRLRAGVRQIGRSLVLRGRRSGDGHLVIINGKNQISLRKLLVVAGEELERPDDAFIQEVVGYDADGVPPFGHRQKLHVHIDRDITTFHNGWFPAGSPRVWMFLRTDLMVQASGGRLHDLKVVPKKKAKA